MNKANAWLDAAGQTIHSKHSDYRLCAGKERGKKREKKLTRNGRRESSADNQSITSNLFISHIPQKATAAAPQTLLQT